ncbi:Ser/Thr protein phosphatase protein [Mycena rebaudengoi]|nr:Ser/Thr protein phosphatase protein [Mycena rebaudengoi]
MDNLSPRIQFMSDLHLEVKRRPNSGSPDTGAQYTFDFPVYSDILALLGDIGNTKDERLFLWLSIQLTRFKLILFVAGNHEAYGSTLEDSTLDLVQFAAECESAAATAPPEEPLGKFIFLNRDRFDVSPTLTVLGCTLWSRLDLKHIDVLRMGLSDFSHIIDFDADVYDARHKEDASWLKETIAYITRNEPERQIIVLTHHAPTVADTSDPKHVGGPSNSAFTTELLKHICSGGAVKVWAFGHTHWNCDFVRAGVRVVANQRGYRDADPGFDPGQILEINNIKRSVWSRLKAALLVNKR